MYACNGEWGLFGLSEDALHPDTSFFCRSFDAWGNWENRAGDRESRPGEEWLGMPRYPGSRARPLGPSVRGGVPWNSAPRHIDTCTSDFPFLTLSQNPSLDAMPGCG